MTMNAVNDCQIIEFRKISDKRGCLSVIEECKEIPFKINAVRWLICQSDKERIPISFKMGNEKFIVALSGEFDIAGNSCAFRPTHLDKPNQGLYINDNINLEILNFTKNSVALILSSESR